MKLKDFLKEYAILIGFYFTLVFLFFLFFQALRIDYIFLFLYLLLFFLFGIFSFFYLYFRKHSFYSRFSKTLQELDQKYLITEMDFYPSFLEGRYLMDILYDIDKSMKDKIVFLESKNQGFRDYIEMWIHEVKLPLANLVLLLHNDEKDHSKIGEQVIRIESLVEQVLYYVRSETVHQDYFIKKCSLKKIVNEVIQKNKDVFILNHISLEVQVLDYVLTDAKWMSFILNQILSNSFKYQKDNHRKIVIKSSKKGNQVLLKIWDNGIGIGEDDLKRVFDKSFTGNNGRKYSSSTGMGLYICHNLIEKLGHSISISSIVNEFTEVTITFSEHEFYQVLEKE